jgi:hypothetical protein
MSAILDYNSASGREPHPRLKHASIKAFPS